MLSFLMALASGVAAGSAELDVSDSDRARGSLSVVVSFSSDVQTSSVRRKQGELNRNLPANDLSLISPNTIASWVDTNLDSERTTVALTTGSTAPRSVKSCKAPETSLNSASKISPGYPLHRSPTN